jgi:hypothetical protein
MLKLGYFRPITFNETMKVSDIMTPIFDENTSFEFDSEICCRKITDKNVKDMSNKPIFYADFEASVNEKYHVPYMCSVADKEGKTQTFIGRDCTKQLLEYLPKESIIYFHNLAYNFSFLASQGVCHMIKKGTRNMYSKINYFGKILYFKDSFSVISTPLSKFPKMFKIDSKKELFPYRYYCKENFKDISGSQLDDFTQNCIGIIDECGCNEDPKWTTKECEEFNKNIDSIPECRVDKERFNMYLYAKFYCEENVKILRQGLTKFSKELFDVFGIKTVDFVSISALTNEIMRQNVYIPNGNL